MTDEELGRAWAAKHGRSPKVYDDHAMWFHPTWDFGPIDIPSGKSTLSPVVWSVVRRMIHPTESAAYAALGAALRRITEHVSV